MSASKPRRTPLPHMAETLPKTNHRKENGSSTRTPGCFARLRSPKYLDHHLMMMVEHIPKPVTKATGTEAVVIINPASTGSLNLYICPLNFCGPLVHSRTLHKHALCSINQLGAHITDLTRVKNRVSTRALRKTLRRLWYIGLQNYT